MKKFKVLYHAPKGAMEQKTNSSPEEMKKGMEAWMSWAEKCGDSLVDMGAPLGTSEFVGGEESSTICGFSVVQAEKIEDAKALFEGHPHLGWAEGCTIEILEYLPMPSA
jgi:hypothetical protein